MYKIILTRLIEVANAHNPKKPEGSTLGQFQIFDENERKIFDCFTIENAGPSSNVRGSDKRILPGEYYLEWCDSGTNASLAKKFPKWKLPNGRNKTLWIKSKTIPDFDGRLVRIHVANYSNDVEACIGLGYYKNDKLGHISQSIVCMNDFQNLMEKLDLKNVSFIIKDI